MRSRFHINGHPIHPILVTVPIGLLVWAFTTSVIYVVRHDRVWYDISYWTAIAGVVSALVTALPGFGDYVTMAMHTKARGIATAHMLLNLGLVVLFAISAFLMRDDGALDGSMLTVAVVLQGIGTGMLLLSGFFGGEMVFRHHLAVIPEDEEMARDQMRRHGSAQPR